MRLLVRNGDLIGARRRAYLAEIVAKNRFKSKMLAQIRGPFGKRFTADDGTECVELVYLKTGGGRINRDLIELLHITDTDGIRKKKVHPVWIYFAPGISDEELSADNRATIAARVRELAEKYGIDGVTIHWRIAWGDPLRHNDRNVMEPDWWRPVKGDAPVAAEDADEVNLIGQIMFDAHKAYKGESCEARGKNPYASNRSFLGGEEVCTAASYTVKTDADAIVKAVTENIEGRHDRICRGGPRRGGCGGGITNFTELAKRLKTQRPVRPGEELAFHILYKSDTDLFKYVPGTLGMRTGVSIAALADMTSTGFVEFFSKHIQVDYHYHKSTWEKIKGFVMHLLAFASVVIGAWQLTAAFQAAGAAFSAAMSAGSSTAAAVWEGTSAFFMTMAGASTAEFFGSDYAAATYAAGMVNTYSTITTLQGIGAAPEYARRTATPEQAEQSTDVSYATDSFVDAMMPDARIAAMLDMTEI